MKMLINPVQKVFFSVFLIPVCVNSQIHVGIISPVISIQIQFLNFVFFVLYPYTVLNLKFSKNNCTPILFG